MLIIAILLGCFIGFSFAYMITAIMVTKSNDHGDSKGTLAHFAQTPLHMIQSKNNIKKPKF